MSFINLSKEEKTRSVIYVTNHELSKNQTMQNKQFEMLAVLLKYYVKGCDYSHTGVRVFRTEKYNVVYTFYWPDNMEDMETLTELDMMLRDFAHRTERYKKTCKILNEIHKDNPRPTDDQKKLVYNFKRLFEDWHTYDDTDIVNIYNKKYWLQNYISEYETRDI